MFIVHKRTIWTANLILVPDIGGLNTGPVLKINNWCI